MIVDNAWDVIVLGSGVAGLAAALAAHERGLRPIVLEKAGKLGGGTVHSYGLIWVGGNHLAQTTFRRGEHQWKLAASPGSNRSLGTIEEPPFYGIELRPSGGAAAGLLADVNGQVIHQRRHPIPGLYASGNVAAATEQGVGYQAGMSLAASMTFSYLAVRHMMDRG